MDIISEKKIGRGVLRLVKGDITQRNTDAIVNAANSYLRHGGGVAGAIVRKGGQTIQDESDKIGFTPVGTAVITGAGSLPSKFVIHAVGPRMGEGGEDKKLKSAISNALAIASQRHLRSISIPAVSSGIFGFPKDRCAKILVAEAAAHLKRGGGNTLELIEFCIFDETTLGHFKKEFLALKDGA